MISNCSQSMLYAMHSSIFYMQLRLLRGISTAAKQPMMTWSEFFVHRKARIIIERFGGTAGLAAGFVGSAVYFLMVADFDPMAPPPLGLPDPAMASFLGIFCCAGAGFIGGTLSANPLWRLIKNK